MIMIGLKGCKMKKLLALAVLFAVVISVSSAFAVTKDVKDITPASVNYTIDDPNNIDISE